MTKLYEVKTPQEWTNLADIVDGSLPEIVELFNAGREGGVDILYTGSIGVPVIGAFYKILKRQKSTILTTSTQPIWVKSELQGAKLIVSSSSSEIEALNGSTLAADLAEIKSVLNGNAVVAWDDTTTVNVVYLKYLSGKIYKVNKVDKTILTAQAGGTWANRATTNVYTEGGV